MEEKFNNKTCGECFYFDHIGKKLCDLDLIVTREDRTACDEFAPLKPKTNGDKIRAMSDEELALLIVRGRCRLCPYSGDVNDCYNNTAKSCKDIILEQLKKEVKDE